MREQDLWWRLEWHRVQAMRGIGGQVEDRGNVVLVLNPNLPAKGFNFACKVDAGETSKDAVIDYVVEAFRRHGLAPHFQLWPITRPDDFSAELWSRGFQEGGELEVMVWKRAPGLRAPKGVTIRPALGDEDLDAAVDLVIQGFDFPPEWKPVMKAPVADASGQVASETFLAEVEGEPAGVAAFVRTGDGIAGVYSVATAPAFRRRGIATALTLHCLEVFQESGDDILTLQVAAGSEAQRLYGKLGFEKAYLLSLYTLV
ncbi:MAG: GNAT family N-acetyltransferase [Euryarchaeota archaeon]|nr:GNAT family N-acetyltransferase [Euryarchaeota archaeon]